jgi:hypothetical protein
MPPNHVTFCCKGLKVTATINITAMGRSANLSFLDKAKLKSPWLLEGDLNTGTDVEIGFVQVLEASELYAVQPSLARDRQGGERRPACWHELPASHAADLLVLPVGSSFSYSYSPRSAAGKVASPPPPEDQLPEPTAFASYLIRLRC